MRVLVCGGRDFNNERWLHRSLTQLHQEHRFDTLIEGGALGADRLAREWAEGMAIRVETFEADWGTHGKAAGPIRNRRMLEEGRPDLVVAFPGGRGTGNMIQQAKRAGVRVLVFPESVDATREWVRCTNCADDGLVYCGSLPPLECPICFGSKHDYRTEKRP